MSPRAYPHLLPAEAIIWARWIRLHGDRWERFDYDVRVGQGRPVDPTWAPEIQRMARTLTLKRIDAVGFVGDVPTIFEVTPRGTRTTYGAVQLYQRLYRDTFAYSGPLTAAVVTVRIDPDVLAALQAEMVEVFLLDPTPGE